MMTPDVSILIPVYNEEVYLPRCLDSIVRPVSYTHLTLPTIA